MLQKLFNLLFQMIWGRKIRRTFGIGAKTQHAFSLTRATIIDRVPTDFIGYYKFAPFSNPEWIDPCIEWQLNRAKKIGHSR